MKACDMRANFDLSRCAIRKVAQRAGFKIVKTYPQSEFQLHIIGYNGASHSTGDNSTQCTTATVARTYTTMRLIAVLAEEQKDCLISCKSLG